MKFALRGVLAALLLVGFGLASGSAQAFFPSRIKGTVEIKFPAPVGNQEVQVAVDDQPVGNLPATIYVQPGPHKFTFTAGGEQSSMTYPVKSDMLFPSMSFAKTFALTVNTNVPGAQMALDGKPFAGNSTQTTAGNHTLTINAAGYQSITLPFSQPTQANVLNITLIANSFALTVNTNVPAAQLALDGVPFPGKTTQTAPGNHSLTVSAPGYQTVTVPFVQPNQANILNITLVASTFGLTVNTNVPNAQLALDGVPFAGNATQATAGNHTLMISAPGFQTLTLPFVQPSQANILNVTLVASTFALTVNTNVPGAQLALDGVPFPGNATQASAGNHTLTVSAAGYQTVSVPFVQPSQANILNITLIASTGTVNLNLDRLPRAAYKVFVNNAEAKGFVQTLTPGSYLIRVQGPNLSVETTVTVAAGQNLTLTPSVQWELR